MFQFSPGARAALTFLAAALAAVIAGQPFDLPGVVYIVLAALDAGLAAIGIIPPALGQHVSSEHDHRAGVRIYSKSSRDPHTAVRNGGHAKTGHAKGTTGTRPRPHADLRNDGGAVSLIALLALGVIVGLVIAFTASFVVGLVIAAVCAVLLVIVALDGRGAVPVLLVLAGTGLALAGFAAAARPASAITFTEAQAKFDAYSNSDCGNGATWVCFTRYGSNCYWVSSPNHFLCDRFWVETQFGIHNQEQEGFGHLQPYPGVAGAYYVPDYIVRNVG